MIKAKFAFAPFRVKMACVVSFCVVATLQSACSSYSSRDSAAANQEDASAQSAAPTITPLPETEIETTRAFDEDSLYALLTAEIALTRAHYKLGLDNYVERALSSQDVNVASRATQIARILKQRDQSLQMAELWKELDPGNREPRFILVSEYTHNHEFDKAFEQAQILLESGHKAGFEDIAVEAVESDYTNLDTLSEQYAALLTSYGENSSLRTGLSILYQKQDQLDQALVQIQAAYAADPDNVRVIYQKYRVLLAQEKREEAAETYGRLVELQPDNFQIRSRYAHQLLRIDLKEAMKQYAALYEQQPQNNDVLLNLGLLQREQKKYKDAETSFATLIERGEHLHLSHFNIAEIYKERGELDAALKNYLLVDSGNRYVDAVASAADIINKQEGMSEALDFVSQRRQLASSKAETQKDAEELYLIEGDVLQRNGNHIAAVNIYSEGVAEFPNSITLHYSRAMLHASNDQTVKAEADFMQALKFAPESATILNALGYTLLVQTDRIDDAGSFIEQAYALAPEDAAIIDSMGWLHFKRGKPRTALKYLKEALDKVYDAEIVAHLSETLWVLGKKRLAKEKLREGIERFPDSPHLVEVVSRLKIRF